jgi:predicted DNA-binding transcriptional regulator AlpA
MEKLSGRDAAQARLTDIFVLRSCETLSKMLCVPRGTIYRAIACRTVRPPVVLEAIAAAVGWSHEQIVEVWQRDRDRLMSYELPEERYS